MGEVKYEEICELLCRKTGAEGTAALSPTTVRGIVTVLRSVFQYAQFCGYDILQWERIRRPKTKKAIVKTLTESEQQRLREFLLDAVDYKKLGVLLCMFTGIRLGEVCAMKWGDISPNADVVTVKATVQRIRNPEYTPGRDMSKTMVVFSPPKSKSSFRDIPLPSFLAELLKQMRCENDCFLLTGTAARFMEPRMLQNAFASMLAEAGIEHINFHALRHTFATNCVNLGFDVKALSEILGHADISMTLNTYVHSSFSRKKQFMEQLK